MEICVSPLVWLRIVWSIRTACCLLSCGVNGGLLCLRLSTRHANLYETNFTFLSHACPFLCLFSCVYSPGAHAMPVVVVRFDSPCLLWVFLNVYATVLFSGSCTIKTPCPAVAQWQPQAVIVHHGPRDDHFTGPGGFRVALTISS